MLVTGSGSGISSFALQIAKKLGTLARMTSGSDDKLARACEMGANRGANYRTQEWAKEIPDLTGFPLSSRPRFRATGAVW